MIYVVVLQSAVSDPDALVLAALSEFGPLKRALPGTWLFATNIDLGVIADALQRTTNGTALYVICELRPNSWVAFLPLGAQIDDWLTRQDQGASGAISDELRQAAMRRLAAQFLKKQEG